MDKHQAKQKIEELTGRLDTVKSEMASAQRDYEQYTSQNLMAEARAIEQDLERLRQRRTLMEQALSQLYKV